LHGSFSIKQIVVLTVRVKKENLLKRSASFYTGNRPHVNREPPILQIKVIKRLIMRTAFYISDGTAITSEVFGHATLSMFPVDFNHKTIPFVTRCFYIYVYESNKY